MTDPDRRAATPAAAGGAADAPAGGDTRSHRRATVTRLFDGIAHRYDLLNRLLSAGLDGRWRRRAVALLSPEARRVLDVAAGTGDLAAAFLDARPGGEAAACDPSPAMAARAARKLDGRAGWRGVVLGAAERLPFADASFDAAMAAFGARNFADLAAGLGEMARVVRPGGELLVLEFFPAEKPLVAGLFRLYFHGVLPAVGGLVSGNRTAYRYLPGSVDSFLARDAFADLLARLGLADIRRVEFMGGVATAFHARRPMAGML
ncbi:MAG: ubiquinone/menaquinone biosynthesis methyltransferase [Candidatus Krumholzibacteriota bacterium]|nr:ubiquinone/menaquinone biosynthesis methyltransferase [Candidatus Krumholzibacteriota bacterium]